MVDTVGLVIVVLMTAASVQDSDRYHSPGSGEDGAPSLALVAATAPTVGAILPVSRTTPVPLIWV